MQEILGFKPKKGPAKIKIGHYYFCKVNAENLICLVNSKNASVYTVHALSPATQGPEYDSFDNQRFFIDTNQVIDVPQTDMLHEANILHDCSDGCTLNKDPVRFTHAQDNNFVLNSYSFSLYHTGRLDSVD
jgi:hypothetical protein